MLTNRELKDIEKSIVSFLYEEIGPIVKNYSGTKFESYGDKMNEVDLVTKIDKEVEKLIKAFVQEKYPDFGFIGEESYIHNVTEFNDKPTFVVDPIDGTTNFIHGFPFSCTSIGVTEGGKPVVGCVYNPHLDQLFHASAGNGAYLNDEPIKVKSRPLSLQKSIVGLEGGSERKDGPEDNFSKKMDIYKSLLSENGAFVHGFRSMGSAAMNLCYVAMGYMDSYWEGGCWAWDVCAGWCILAEVGGTVVGGSPGEWDIPINNRCYLAVRGGYTSQDGLTDYINEFWSYITTPLEY
ncbi:hypothetical protein RNJ44_00825 [Nakaseomyces bracarensis]|uniref:Inositol-1-monophosphatase n=1 Tax=Nakaseomyces bracarensis TaxID=273131 RepID=A0ABR4NS70_9SACH